MSMLKPENNPYSKQYQGPPMCKCCNTLPLVASKAFCMTCSHLSIAEHALVKELYKPSLPPSERELIQESLSPAVVIENDPEFHCTFSEALQTRSAEVILAEETPLPTPLYPTCYAPAHLVLLMAT
jgi:hypothetical protein